MDLDSDGKQDLISGSWPGELYFFKGKGKGKFSEPTVLKDKAGKEINIDKASTVFATDWRGTGRLDLLVGGIKGHVHLLPNTAKSGPPAFGKPIALTCNGEEIKVPHGDSHPIAADWENTGLPGLIVGCGDGSVLWYRNVGRAGAPEFEGPFTLVKPATPPAFDGAAPSPAKVEPGMRAKVSAYDWDGDGQLELLVGDVAWIRGKNPRLSKEQIALRDETKARIEEIVKSLQPHYEKIREKIAKIKGEKKQQAEAQKLYADVQKRFSDEMEEVQTLYQTVRPLEAAMQTNGRVWLYQR